MKCRKQTNEDDLLGLPCRGKTNPAGGCPLYSPESKRKNARPDCLWCLYSYNDQR